MTHRIRFIERLRGLLHLNVDKIVDSLYEPEHQQSKTNIQSMKVDLDKLQNQIKQDD